MNLSDNVQVAKVLASVASGASDSQNGVHVDMQGYDGVMFFCTLSAFAATNYLKAQQGEAVGDGDMADLAGTKVSPTANSNIAILDVYRPKERYVRPVIVRGVAATTIGDVYAVRYCGRKRPELNTVTGGICVLAVSPAEGAVS
jgi:hypothetical protein